MNMYEHYVDMSYAHDTCMHVEFYIVYERVQTGARPAARSESWDVVLWS